MFINIKNINKVRSSIKLDHRNIRAYKVEYVENSDSAGKWDHVITRVRALLTEVIDIIQVEELAKSSNCL